MARIADSYALARARGAELANAPSAIVSARYVSRPKRGVVFTLRNGVSIHVPLFLFGLEQLTRARPADLEEIEIDPMGETIWFPRVDEGISVAGMMIAMFRVAARRELNISAAKSTSERKANASRENGRKGGRPRKAS